VPDNDKSEQRSIRAFIGSPVGADVLASIQDAGIRIKKIFPQARIISPENLHITLSFVGDISIEEVDKVKAILDVAAEKLRPGCINLQKFGGFSSRGPARKPVRGLWLEDVDPSKELLKVYQFLQESLLSEGFDVEKRAPRPHVTITRFSKSTAPGKSVVQQALKELAFETLRLELNELVLYQSELSSAGASYKRLYTTRVVGME
jgi:2'-5' RNA ligase